MSVCAACGSSFAAFFEADGTAVCRRCYVQRNPTAAATLQIAEARPSIPVRVVVHGQARVPTIHAEGTLTACPKCLFRFTKAATTCPVCDGPVERITIFERVRL